MDLKFLLKLIPEKQLDKVISALFSAFAGSGNIIVLLKEGDKFNARTIKIEQTEKFKEFIQAMEKATSGKYDAQEFINTYKKIK